MICDGVSPSNEGRGYVLRSLLRRAARHGRLLGISGAFLGDLCDVVVEQSGGAYPELVQKKDYIKKIISMEEERFDATIDAGLSILSGFIADCAKDGKKVLCGEDVFKLYDTFGFPPDLTAEIAAENGLETDSVRFKELMDEQKQRARAARADLSSWEGAKKGVLADIAKTEFTGYGNTESEGCVLALLGDDGKVAAAGEGDEISVILDKTPFYGEGGGQVGDVGYIRSAGAELEVTDTKKEDGVYIHICTVRSGDIHEGDSVTASVCPDVRAATERNHSAAHLLQGALRKVLGSHVGSRALMWTETKCALTFLTLPLSRLRSFPQ